MVAGDGSAERAGGSAERAGRVLVAGVDTSTQSCKVVVRDVATGALVRSGRAAHPDGSEIHPDRWWDAFRAAAAGAGGLDDVAALAVGGQQHGMVCLDADGEVIRPALLWNDTRSAGAARDLIAELGAAGPGARAPGAAGGPGAAGAEPGGAAWAGAVGSVPVASLTVTKLRWLRDNEPRNAARIAAVALPHDWLTWRIAGFGPRSQGLEPRLDDLVTDRSDASGTGYFDGSADGGRGAYRRDLLRLALGRDDVVLPRVLGPAEAAGTAAAAVAGGDVPGGALLGPGAGDNAAAALGLGLRAGDVGISIGTSGVVSAISEVQTADASGLVNGFSDATGRYLLLAVTLNAARVLDAARSILGVDHGGLARLALRAPAGAGGLVLVPYLEGERTPNRPDATGTVHGLTLATATPECMARAFVEGMLCALADGLDAVRALGVPVERLVLIGGGAQSEAVRRIAPQVFGLPVSVPEPGEYVADGAARQAAWALRGGDEPPAWSAGPEPEVHHSDPSDHDPALEQRYREAAGLYLER